MKTVSYLFVFALVLFAVSSCKTTSQLSKKQIKDSMVKALEWQEANLIFAKAPTDWTNGAYYTGVVKAHQATGNEKYLQALTDMAKRNQWQTWERFYHADDVAISYAYIYLKTLGLKDVDLNPTDTFIKDHLNKPHDWRDGVDKGEKKVLWWWCDALFMAPPVLTTYAKMNSDPYFLDQMTKYYKQTDSLLFDKDESLFARDLRFVWKGEDTDEKEPNGKKVFWSRGNGWVFGGLALILEDMPKDYKNRGYFENLYKTMAIRIKNLQHEDGLWRVSLLNPEGYTHGEVSGSGFFTFALAWGVNNGILEAKEYKPAILKAWQALQSCQQEDGKVGWVQNIGFDPKPADKDSWQNYGTGAFLLAGSEVLKLK